MDDQTAFDRQVRAQDFRRRSERGVYQDLYDNHLREILHDASAARDVNQELGAVRFALAKLLAEETDPRHLASGVSRLVATASRLVTTREALQTKIDEQDDPFVHFLAMDLASEMVNRALATPGGIEELAAWQGAGAIGAPFTPTTTAQPATAHAYEVKEPDDDLLRSLDEDEPILAAIMTPQRPPQKP
jgi:hypothetical protein